MSNNPILLDFPAEFESERLIIRAPRPGDGAAMHAAVMESRDDLRPWLPWAENPADAVGYEALCRRKYAEWMLREDLMITLWRKSDGAYVGGSGMHRIDWAVPCMEIGYWLRTSMVGHGYMTEAVGAVTGFAFTYLGARRIEIRTDAQNTRSIAVAERVGYTLEARLRHQQAGVDGSLRDTLIYVAFPPEGDAAGG